jgi:beta-aspartyl-peptidase (threonine type)
MIVVTSTNGLVGIREAMRVLRAGGSAVDAVEAGIRLVEANPDDHTVGYGGYPNLLGQVELDAGIMDGHTLGVGAVGAVQGYMHPISIARRVMEELPHVLLVGQGAERFAAEMGFQREELLTADAREVWKQGLQTDIPPEVLDRFAEQPDLWKWVGIATDPERAMGTVNFLAQDSQGNLCTGVSTSGWAWKYPGRIGDSPIVGAGLYADNRYGAAACTGMGEMAIRASTARSILLYLKMGMSLSDAEPRAMEDLNDLGGPYLSDMSFVALDASGQHAGFSNVDGKTYVYITEEMDQPVEIERTYIHTNRHWVKRNKET